MENSRLDLQEKQNNFDFLEQFFLYLRFWHYFLISVIVSLFVVNYYLNHTIPTFESKAKIKIIDDSKNSFVLPSSSLGLFGKNKVNLDNEIEVLKSYRLLEQVCKSLGLNNQYFNVGYLNNVEIWKNRPFTIEWLDNSVEMDDKSISFEIEIDKDGYKVISSSETESKKRAFNTIQHINKIPYKLSLQIGTNLNDLIGRKFLITHTPIKSLALGLSGRLAISNSNKNSDVLILSLSGANKDKSELILNEIIRQFELDGLKDRKLVSQRTIDFVNERFKSIESQLDSVEISKANYKSNQGLTFIGEDAITASLGKVDASKDVFQIETQIELAKVLEQTIKSDKSLGLLPANIGLSNNGINQSISEYNSVVLERERQSVSSGVNNPIIQSFNNKLTNLKLNIIESIKGYQKELSVSLSKNDYIQKASSSKFSAIPFNEKVLRGIERQQNIKETLYLLLLQKREEAAVNLAITSSNLKIVDFAMTSSSPVSPKRGTFYIMAILIGLFIPFLFLYIRFLLDDKLHTKEDITKLTKNKIILSEVPHINSEIRLTGINDRSILGESFRILRTNLTYIFPLQKEKTAQTIMITSTIKGEGKTFTALNLSISFSIMNKKVLLIGADMRNPQLHTYLKTKKNQVGLQDYLHNISIDWHNAINKNILDNPNLDIILSGTIPPNPAELLANGQLEKLISEAKNEYDYVIIDTPPTLLVTDTLVISHLVDSTLYVVRADFTPKKLLEFSVNLSDKGKLRNMAYVINNVGSKYKGYGAYGYNYKYNYAYGYGYGYDADLGTKKSLISRMFSFFKK
jgi:capsular exopolysaccharide synthesis family protein